VTPLSQTSRHAGLGQVLPRVSFLLHCRVSTLGEAYLRDQPGLTPPDPPSLLRA